MSAVATQSSAQPTANGRPTENLPAIAPPRLPFHPAIEERFGVDRASWKALVEAIFPNATTIESVILALSYCRARKLDPFKRNVHIVPIWNKQLGRMVDTIWPGIGELRTTAFRTGEYAGRGQTIFGPTITQKVGNLEVTFPEWAQVSVFRVVKGQRVEFAGPKVYWLETYATYKRDDDTPNEMWGNRPFGQIEKCAEAAALRAGFPEEVGTEYIAEEVQHSRSKQVENTAGLGALKEGRGSFRDTDQAPAETPIAVSGTVDPTTGEVDGATHIGEVVTDLNKAQADAQAASTPPTEAEIARKQQAQELAEKGKRERMRANGAAATAAANAPASDATGTPVENAKPERSKEEIAADLDRAKNGCRVGTPGCSSDISIDKKTKKPVCSNHAPRA